MRVALALALVSVLGCASSEEPNNDVVSYRVDGALTGLHQIQAEPGSASESLTQTKGAWGDARIGCSMVNASDSDPSRGKVFVLSAVENYGEEHGAGVYMKVRGFTGAGSYALDSGAGGQTWVFDNAHIQACARAGDRTCFQGVEGCTMNVTRWDFAPGVAERPAGYPEQVAFGVAEGTFSCRRLVNDASSTSVSIPTGTFRCHVGDWTKP